VTGSILGGGNVSWKDAPDAISVNDPNLVRALYTFSGKRWEQVVQKLCKENPDLFYEILGTAHQVREQRNSFQLGAIHVLIAAEKVLGISWSDFQVNHPNLPGEGQNGGS
jgi:hypothetical protein